MPKSSTELQDDLDKAIVIAFVIEFVAAFVWIINLIVTGDSNNLLGYLATYIVGISWGFYRGMIYVSKKQKELYEAIIREKTGLQ